MILDDALQVVSSNAEARVWFGEIQRHQTLGCAGVVLDVPNVVTHAAQAACMRCACRDEPHAETRTRVRTRSGGWLTVHASCLTDADGGTGSVAVVIAPAKASDMAPLLIEAYELTARELDVTRALARGLTTGEIAQSLFLSRYTVQDHLKRIYEKVGVSSRGELVAKVYADPYHERRDAAITGAEVRTA